jgi:hypothetical protein
MSGWNSYAPRNERGRTPAALSAAAERERSRRPAATITLNIYSTKTGDSEMSLTVDRQGPMRSAEGDLGAARNQELLRIKRAALRELGAAFEALER